MWIALGVVAVVVIGLVVFVATRPAVFVVERSGEVGAGPGVVYAIVNDLTQWRRWSPYDKRDPGMKVEYDGPAAGVGAGYAWNGNGQVGEGRMRIVESVPVERVGMKLEFTRPFACRNDVMFRIVPAAGGSRVTWRMEGPNKLMSKVMSLFINMDKMVGRDFEAGLVNLDRAARADVAKG